MNLSRAGVSKRSEIESGDFRSSVCRIIDIDPRKSRAGILEDRERRSRRRISALRRPAFSRAYVNIGVSVDQLDGGVDIVAERNDIGRAGHFVCVSSIVVEFHRNDVVDPTRGLVQIVRR